VLLLVFNINLASLLSTRFMLKTVAELVFFIYKYMYIFIYKKSRYFPFRILSKKFSIFLQINIYIFIRFVSEPLP
jgi:hypothetical protein